jgi:A118 family predicted phage portal protein
MPLPKGDTPWPPVNTQPVYSKMAEWAAWYSGEPQRIIDVYAGQSAVSGGTIPWWRFWRRAVAQRDGSQRALLHVPVASDLAAVSAALVFGEAPRFRMKEAHEDEPLPPATPRLDPMKSPGQQNAELAGDPRPAQPFDPANPGELDPGAAPQKKTMTSAEKVEKRLIEILNRGQARSRLVEAGETAAAIGGVYIYPAWDKDMFDIPIIAVAQTDMAVPTWRWGFLTAVTFHRIIDTSDGQVWRHVEVHEVEGTGDSRKAVVLHGLYKGNASHLGQEVALTAHDETAMLPPRVELPFKELDVQYIPNIRPNRLWRASGHGVADIQGSETLLDAIDETYASWMRDVRLSKARIIVPRDYLRSDLDNEGNPTFDVDQEVYTTMEMEPAMNSDARAMLAHQFAIRYMEHRSTAREFIERVVSNAGYAPASLGQATDSAGVARTGAALRVSEHKSVLTQRRKAAHWKSSLEMLCRHLLLIDKEEFGGDIPIPEKDLWPSVEMSDSIIDQPLELAQTALALKTAESASIETRVKIIHPDWSDSEVASEVARIQDESAVTASLSAPPSVGAGKFGDPEKDPKSGSASFPVTDQTRGRQTHAPPPSPPLAKKA